MFFEQAKLLLPYIAVGLLFGSFFISGLLRIFFIFTICVVYFISMFGLVKYDFQSINNGNKVRLKVDDTVQFTVDNSENCIDGDHTKICADYVEKLPYEFEVDLSCKIDSYKYKDTEIFLINRVSSLKQSDLYVQRVCLRRLASLLRRQGSKAIVAGNFGSFANAASVKLLAKSVNLDQVQSWGDLGKQFFRTNPHSYIFVEKVKLGDYISGHGFYEFELS